ncbi:hypothetical protein GQX74_011774 [Glossina fuscipes]|nr:hypothetical protein GQX74_011774 [Glossina fuscipes]
MGPPMPLKNPKAIAKYKCQGSLAIPCTNERKTSLANAISTFLRSRMGVHPYLGVLNQETVMPNRFPSRTTGLPLAVDDAFLRPGAFVISRTHMKSFAGRFQNCKIEEQILY